jgi:hypothetical protein
MPAAVLLLPRCHHPLCLDNARGDEEDQLLVGGADLAMFEQVAQVWDVPQQRYLGYVD